MYVPAHFAAGPAAVDELLARHGAADLITLTADGLIATMLPFAYEPAAGGHGALYGHVARNNGQWRKPAIGESLAIVRGPDEPTPSAPTEASRPDASQPAANATTATTPRCSRVPAGHVPLLVRLTKDRIRRG
jgi:hypothetical protein